MRRGGLETCGRSRAPSAQSASLPRAQRRPSGPPLALLRSDDSLGVPPARQDAPRPPAAREPPLRAAGLKTGLVAPTAAARLNRTPVPTTTTPTRPCATDADQAPSSACACPSAAHRQRLRPEREREDCQRGALAPPPRAAAVRRRSCHSPQPPHTHRCVESNGGGGGAAGTLVSETAGPEGTCEQMFFFFTYRCKTILIPYSSPLPVAAWRSTRARVCLRVSPALAPALQGHHPIFKKQMKKKAFISVSRIALLLSLRRAAQRPGRRPTPSPAHASTRCC